MYRPVEFKMMEVHLSAEIATHLFRMTTSFLRLEINMEGQKLVKMQVIDTPRNKMMTSCLSVDIKMVSQQMVNLPPFDDAADHGRHWE